MTTMEETAHQRKIELQSPDDLSYLINNIRRAAAVEIEKALPQMHTAGEERREDDMRVVVEKLVDQYIQTTLKSLLPNITINGLPPDPNLLSNGEDGKKKRSQMRTKEQHVFEPFNAKTWSRATDLMAQESELIEEIARLRRTVPATVVQREKDAFEKVNGEDDAIILNLEEMAKSRTEGGIQGEKGVELEGQLEGERLESVRTGYGKGVEGLERVVEKGPGLVAKVEKASRAEAYVLGGR